MATFSDLFTRLDPDPRVRGKQFEQVCKWFLTNDPTYKNTLRRVWLWSEWTGRWGGDAGIDLVAEDHEGRLWAIQAKAYAPENTITKADVDKFLAESSRAVFSYRLLIATTDKLHHVRTADDQRPGEAGRLRGAERPTHLRGELAHQPLRHAPVPAAEAR
ncbi:restriction endonuclease [Mycobacterium intracellulare]|uniref:restriction endonuclease n=1 Tax=Mycobacterium intracellulare TaxID=1767 RepID=UPI001CDA0FE2|nr:restriction endonuclease [Mycobacterium intracellulare]